MKVIDVAVGAIMQQDQVLLSRRPEGVHLAGYWEFPGGKFESGDNPLSALNRELDEELGIQVRAATPLITIPFQYPGKAVRLHIFKVNAFEGEPWGREAQELNWVPVSDLGGYRLPPANRGIVTALQLPDQYLITPRYDGDLKQFLARLEGAVERGVRLIQLRQPAMNANEFAELARAVIAFTRHHSGVKLVFNSHLDLAAELGAHGVHLSANQAAALSTRPLPAGKLLGVSCHSEAELEQAMSLQADFVVLSPVNATASHPHAEPMGWQRFAELTAFASVPVFALGGMQAQDVQQARNLGGQGIAAIRSLWGQ